MGDLLEQGKIAGEKIRTFIGLFRNSSTEIVTATLAVLFFSAVTVVLGNEFVKAVLAPSALEPLRIGCYTQSAAFSLFGPVSGTADRSIRARTFMPSDIAPGIQPSPGHDLIFHGGKTIANLNFFNFYGRGCRVFPSL
jgi:hypothetical protein